MTDPSSMSDDELVHKTIGSPPWEAGALRKEILRRLTELRIAAAVKCSCCQPVEDRGESVSHWGMFNR